MPTTGAFITVGMTKGPGRIYLDCGVPASGANVPIDSTGTPGQGHLMGYTKDGNTITVGFDEEEVNVDTPTTTMQSIVRNETISIAGAAMAIEDLNMMQRIMPNSSLVLGTPVERMSFGNKASLTTIQGILLVWPAKSSPGEWIRFTLYDPMNTAGTNWRVSRSGYGQASYTFVGRAVSSRSTGDTIGALVKDVPF